MSTKPMVVITNYFGMHVNAANMAMGVKNPDGSYNVSGTVLGASQTAHSAVDFARTGVTTVGKTLPFIGAFLGGASVWNSGHSILSSLRDGQSPSQSDIAGLLGGVATVAGGAALLLGGGMVVPLALVAGVGLGAYQVAASAKGWTLDDATNLFKERPLTAEEKAQVKQAMQEFEATPEYQQCLADQVGSKPSFNAEAPFPPSPGLLDQPGFFDQPDFSDPEVQRLIEALADAFNNAQNQASPIILDLDGNGVQTVGLDAGVHFDHNANGFAQQTGWVGQGDGLLVWDINDNGQIDNGRELFGDHTKLANGMRAVNGFEALAQHDSNGDGRIDAQDAIWQHLRVWVDADTNAQAGEGELFTLDQLGGHILGQESNEPHYRIKA